jgi:hypothetical protein
MRQTNKMIEQKPFNHKTGAFRIGNGRVLHPAVKDKNDWVVITCECPNTSNGLGVRSGKFFEGAAPTCKRSKNKGF